MDILPLLIVGKAEATCRDDVTKTRKTIVNYCATPTVGGVTVEASGAKVGGVKTGAPRDL